MLQPSAQNNSLIPKGFLRRRSDFLKTYKGWFVREKLFVLYARKNERSEHRFGVTAPKAMGTAVIRNKFKRWSKELYRQYDLTPVEKSLDINIFLGNKRLGKEEFKNVQHKEFKELFLKSMQSLAKNFR